MLSTIIDLRLLDCYTWILAVKLVLVLAACQEIYMYFYDTVQKNTSYKSKKDLDR